MQRDPQFGGLGLGSTGTSYIFLGCILGLVAFLTVTRRDETPPETVLAEEAHAEHGREHPHAPRGHIPSVEFHTGRARVPAPEEG